MWKRFENVGWRTSEKVSWQKKRRTMRKNIGSLSQNGRPNELFKINRCVLGHRVVVTLRFHPCDRLSLLSGSFWTHANKEQSERIVWRAPWPFFVDVSIDHLTRGGVNKQPCRVSLLGHTIRYLWAIKNLSNAQLRCISVRHTEARSACAAFLKETD